MRPSAIIRIVGAAALLGCSTVPYTDRKQLTLIPQSQLEQMGDEAFSATVQSVPVVEDRAIANYVLCVARPIVEPIENDGRDEWSLAVFQDPSPNAFVLPGGNMGVNLGILKTAKNNDQLAAVIGHEVAHALARHASERVSQQLVAQGGLALIDAIVLGDASPTRRKIWLSALGVGAQLGVLLPYSRTQESEADRIGLELMAKAGYDPAEAADLWKNMSELHGQDSPPTLLSSHPAPEDRMSRLRRPAPEMQKRYEAASSKRCTRPSDARVQAALDRAERARPRHARASTN